MESIAKTFGEGMIGVIEENVGAVERDEEEDDDGDHVTGVPPHSHTKIFFSLGV